MKSIQARLTITFIGLMTALLVVIWGVNRWYLEDFYVDQKVESLMDAYDAVDRQIEENAAVGISVGQAMERRRDSSGNIVEGNLQKLIRDYSDSANVSVLMIDNSSADATVYSTSRDTQFLKDRIDRYIFGWNQSQSELVEEKENYTIQKTFDTRRNSMYLESWGFFSDNSTAFIMSTPLSSIGESVELSNQFLAYVGIVAVIVERLWFISLQDRLPNPSINFLRFPCRCPSWILTYAMSRGGTICRKLKFWATA